MANYDVTLALSIIGDTSAVPTPNELWFNVGTGTYLAMEGTSSPEGVTADCQPGLLGNVIESGGGGTNIREIPLLVRTIP